MIVTNNLVVIKKGCTPTFRTVRLSSTIDITVASVFAFSAHKINDWEVRDITSHSDHKVIAFSLGHTPEEAKERRNSKRANWVLFQQVVNDEELPKEVGGVPYGLESRYNHLESIIAKALDIA